MSRRHRSQYRRSTSGQGWPDSGKENFKMLLFRYNPKYKRNIHESILIRINDWVNKQRKKRQLFLTEKFQITRAHNNIPSPSPTPAPPENGRGPLPQLSAWGRHDPHTTTGEDRARREKHRPATAYMNIHTNAPNGPVGARTQYMQNWRTTAQRCEAGSTA